MNTKSLDEMLRDRLVCGVNDERIQRRLLAEDKLTFTKALQLAQAMEGADRDTKDLNVSQDHQQVHYNTSTKKGDQHGKKRDIICTRQWEALGFI